MSSPTINAMLAMFIEKVMNKALEYDPGTQQALKKLNHSRLNIVCTQPKLEFTFDVIDGAISVASKTNDLKHDMQVTLTGTFQDLAKLIKNDQHSLAQSGVDVSGKAQLLVNFQELFSNLDIDWEEALIEKFGNTAGPQIASALRKTKVWSEQQNHDFQQFFPDYLTQELQLIPSTEEIEYFCEDVDNVKSRYDRIEARIKKLQQHAIKTH